MKISDDLRAAIRSAVSESTSRAARQNAESSTRKRIQEMLALYANKGKAENAREMMRQGQALCKEATAMYESFGVASSESYIMDEEAFKKAGGQIPEPVKSLRFDAVMAAIAKATPEEGEKILKEYGIIWK